MHFPQPPHQELGRSSQWSQDFYGTDAEALCCCAHPWQCAKWSHVQDREFSELNIKCLFFSKGPGKYLIGSFRCFFGLVSLAQ